MRCVALTGYHGATLPKPPLSRKDVLGSGIGTRAYLLFHSTNVAQFVLTKRKDSTLSHLALLVTITRVSATLLWLKNTISWTGEQAKATFVSTYPYLTNGDTPDKRTRSSCRVLDPKVFIYEWACCLLFCIDVASAATLVMVLVNLTSYPQNPTLHFHCPRKAYLVVPVPMTSLSFMSNGFYRFYR